LRRPARPRPVTADQTRDTLRVLHCYGLITHDSQACPRSVRIHALTARAARETTPDPAAVTRTAADALLDLWPANDYTTTDLIEALQTNTTALHTAAGDLLWHPDGHPLLYQAGNSLRRAGLHNPAITHWHTLTDQAERILGAEHPDTIRAAETLRRWKDDE
jgi:hypothetical protein